MEIDKESSEWSEDDDDSDASFSMGGDDDSI